MGMKKLKAYWEQYKEYIHIDLMFYLVMFVVILVFALVKFVF